MFTGILLNFLPPDVHLESSVKTNASMTLPQQPAPSVPVMQHMYVSLLQLLSLQLLSSFHATRWGVQACICAASTARRPGREATTRVHSRGLAAHLQSRHQQAFLQLFRCSG